MENLILELKQEIIKALNLEDISIKDIKDDAPLFGDKGLGLDMAFVLRLRQKENRYLQV